MTTRSAAAQRVGFATSRIQPNLMQTIQSNFGGRPPVPANISPAVMQNLSSAFTEGSPATPPKLPNPNLIQLSPNTGLQFGRARPSEANMIHTGTSYMSKFNNPMYGDIGDIADNNPKQTVRQRLSAFIDRRKTAVQNNAVTFFNPAFQMPEGDNEAPTTSSAFAQFKGKFSPKQSFAQFKEKLPNPKQSLTTAFNKLRQPKQKVASPNFHSAWEGFIPTYDDEPKAPTKQSISPRQRFTNAFNRYRVRLAQPQTGRLLEDMIEEHDEHGVPKLVPASGSEPREDFMRYAEAGKMKYPNILKQVGVGIRRHKRRLAIAAGVIGGVALTGGIIGGTLSHLSKRKRREMQHDASVGVFEKLSDSTGVHGGGSGGGFGNYQRLMASRAYGHGGSTAMPERRRKHYKKKKSGAASKKTRHHFKARRGGRVVKRGRTVKHHKQRRINKRVKKSKKSRKAF